MKKKSYNPVSLLCSDPGSRSYEVEAVLTINARGQIVIPKDVRMRAGITDGDKLVLVSLRDGERICCLTLISAIAFSDQIAVSFRASTTRKVKILNQTIQ